MTREEYCRLIELGILWPDDHVELVDGAIVAAPPKSPRFATAVGLATVALRTVIPAGYHVRVQAPLALDPYSEPEPDLMVVRGSLRSFGDSHPTRADLVVEISDTSVPFDGGRKASLYARSGVADYWYLDLEHRRLWVNRRPVPDAAAMFGHAYREQRSFGGDDQVALLVLPAAIWVRDLLP